MVVQNKEFFVSQNVPAKDCSRPPSQPYGQWAATGVGKFYIWVLDVPDILHQA